MKYFFIILLLTFSSLLLGQTTLPMSAVEGRQELSMGEVTGKSSNGIYRYYAIGSEVPFTGVLYSLHPNGKTDSWQEYEDGVGQGKWINYYANGNYREIGQYEQNRVEGPIEKYYSTGVLKARGTYKDWRIKVGAWQYYNENGDLSEEINYGDKGSIEEVEAYYSRGEISERWYNQILARNGF